VAADVRGYQQVDLVAGVIDQTIAFVWFDRALLQPVLDVLDQMVENVIDPFG
jgi:hypothetical protein